MEMRIAIAKGAFKRKILLLASKLNIELKKKLVMCYVWSIALYGSETDYNLVSPQERRG